MLDFNPDEYRITKKLGEGGNGSVYLLTNKNNKKKRCAMKKIDILDEDQIFLEYVKSEILLLKNLRHKNIVHYLGA